MRTGAGKGAVVFITFEAYSLISSMAATKEGSSSCSARLRLKPAGWDASAVAFKIQTQPSWMCRMTWARSQNARAHIRKPGGPAAPRSLASALMGVPTAALMRSQWRPLRPGLRSAVIKGMCFWKSCAVVWREFNFKAVTRLSVGNWDEGRS